MLAPWKESYDQSRQHIKKQRHYFANKDPSSQSYSFFMYGCESRAIKKAQWGSIDASELCYWRRLLTVPWTARRSNQLILKEISPEYSLEGLTLKLKTPILWPPDAKNWLLGKDPDAGKEWMQEENRTTEEEMVGRHHRLNGHEFEQAPGVGDGQGSLGCCSPWSRKESDMTEWLNWNEHQGDWSEGHIAWATSNVG